MTDRAAVRGMTFADSWRSFHTAIKLGWAIEANWSDPPAEKQEKAFAAAVESLAAQNLLLDSVQKKYVGMNC